MKNHSLNKLKINTKKCVKGFPLTGVRGHAHVRKDCKYHGNICITKEKDLTDKWGNISKVLLHEVAHFIAGSEHGTNFWEMYHILLKDYKAVQLKNKEEFEFDGKYYNDLLKAIR